MEFYHLTCGWWVLRLKSWFFCDQNFFKKKWGASMLSKVLKLHAMFRDLHVNSSYSLHPLLILVNVLECLNRFTFTCRDISWNFITYHIGWTHNFFVTKTSSKGGGMHQFYLKCHSCMQCLRSHMCIALILYILFLFWPIFFYLKHW